MHTIRTSFCFHNFCLFPFAKSPQNFSDLPPRFFTKHLPSIPWSKYDRDLNHTLSHKVGSYEIGFSVLINLHRSGWFRLPSTMRYDICNFILCDKRFLSFIEISSFCCSWQLPDRKNILQQKEVFFLHHRHKPSFVPLARRAVLFIQKARGKIRGQN